MVRYSAGEVIFYAGDHADCMYQIYSGRVGIYSDYKTKNQKLLTELGNEAIFGEMGILDDMPRSATAVCLENCCVLRIGKENFFQFFQKNPMKIIWIIQQMCLRLRNLTGALHPAVLRTLQRARLLQKLPFPSTGRFRDSLRGVRCGPCTGTYRPRRTRR